MKTNSTFLSIKTTAIVLVLILLISFNKIYSQQIVKLTITPQMVTSESNCGLASALFDEQALAGDPKHGTGGSITNHNSGSNINTWVCGYQYYVTYPDYAYVDLGNVYVITDVYLRDVNGYGEFAIYKGYPGKWDYAFSDFCNGYNSWNAHNNTNITSRFLRFKKYNDGSNIAEVVLYGYVADTINIDTISPSAINSLNVDSTSKSGAYLSWIAPGDDDSSGTASYYDLRYNIVPITDQNFGSSVVVSNMITPIVAGSNQSFYVDGLNPGTTYYFAIETRDEKYNVSKLSNIASGTTKLNLNCAPYRIIITPDMIINESVIGNGNKIADEQDIVGDPAGGTGGYCNSYWYYYEGNSPQPWSYPLSILIDLGTNYTITNSCLHNSGWATDNFKIYYSDDPFINKDSASMDSIGLHTWKCLNNQLKENTRYIRITVDAFNKVIGEVAFYGYPTSEYIPEQLPPPLVNPVHPLMKDFIGVNCFNTAPLGRLNCVGFLREYHEWQWNEGNTSSLSKPYTRHNIEWNVGSCGFNFDEFYENIYKQGLTINPVIQNNVPWLINYNNYYISAKPLDTTIADATSPSSYTNHANFMFQMGARFGSTSHYDNELQLASDQFHYTGKGWVKYYENWNEENNWWHGRTGNFTPYEYAAMSSADYDGHEKTLTLNGFNIGLKNADTNAKLVMGGLAEGTLDYYKVIRFWSIHNRTDKKAPFDVINDHQYFYSLNNGIYTTLSPEDYGIKDKMSKFVQYRNKYMPEKEVWLSEFGYNTTANTRYSTPVIGNSSRQEVQARWLIRSYLALAAAGVDKAIAYVLNDESDTTVTGNTYCSSGIIYNKASGYQPKISWYYIYTLKNRLTNFRFKEEVASGNPNITIYSFVDDSSRYVVYALWCPTSVDQTISQYSLNIPYSNAKQITLLNGYINGVDSVLQINQNKVIVNVSEKPIFVIASIDSFFPAVPPQESKIVLNPSMVVNEKKLGNAGNLVDEQSLAGDPLYGNGGSLVTSWLPACPSSYYPVSAYIDLGVVRNITKIYFYDGNGVDNLTISTGTPGNWTPLFTESLDQYLVWRYRTVNINTRYIRLTFANSNTGLREIVLYGNN